MHQTTVNEKTMTWQVLYLFLLFLITTISGQIQYSAFEELKKGSVVGNIANTLNLDVIELSERKFHIVSRAKTQYFSVNLENGDLFVLERIDREMLCGTEQNCFLNVEAVIENPLHFYTFKIEILDINDNSPIFSKQKVDVHISESTLPGARFALGHAQDPDIGTSSIQNYELNEKEYFSLSDKNSIVGNKNLELVLEKTLDREKQSSFELILTAFDGGKPVKTGTVLINIVVLDANDNYPVFSQDTYQVNVHENVPDNFLVLWINATDEDEGSNAKITYSFYHVPVEAKLLFDIDSTSGKIRKTGKLDYELTKNYEITVEAKDGGGLVAHSKVLIQIIDANDNPPEIQIDSFLSIIPEDSLVETVIALINVLDLDSKENGEVVCEISKMLPFQLILLNNNYYKIVTRSSMDREITSHYEITIKATDKGSPPLSTNKTFELTISDVNDNTPIFEKDIYITFMAENNLPGTSIYRIHAVDHDLNENGHITYSIIDNNRLDIPVSSHVSINSVTGVVYALHSFDYEQVRHFQFQVKAEDNGSPPLSNNVTVRICIVDVNDNIPKILYPSLDSDRAALYEFIPHFSLKGYLVTKVIAVDDDTGHNAWLSYHLLQTSDSSLFTIGQHSGEIRISRDFQDGDASRQTLVVLVKDNGSPSFSSTVTINLVIADSFQVLPEINKQPIKLETTPNITFYLVIAIAMISILFILTVVSAVISKCKNSSPVFGTLNKASYPQFNVRCPSQLSNGTLPLSFPYDVCVAIDATQNEFTYLRPIHDVPTENLIDTDDCPSATDCVKENCSKNNIEQVSSFDF
ncbi:hypothetical protein GDO86_005260 [Hymenochirus boettgeri]|uniref:Cadherin domain-containing protein n=1 Tax=Hymenochirus boettgeri TaxID=247094 RepID=A0A8T2J8P0_9PIPI|nr:hypothetical protein GDO86_005260 [Hymenochirus boettgeri]